MLVGFSVRVDGSQVALDSVLKLEKINFLKVCFPISSGAVFVV